MWAKMLKFVGKNLDLHKECDQKKKKQAAIESVNDANSGKQWAKCNVCIEESKQCMCGNLKIENVEGSNVGVHHDANANSSFAHALINMVGMLMGLGQLSIPYAVENGGWASSFLLIGLGVMSAYTSHLLGKCLEKIPKSRSFVDIGGHAFGAKGKFVAATFLYMEIFMALVSFTISLHDNLIIVFLDNHLTFHWIKLTTSQFLTMAAVLISLPSLWLRNLSSISFLSTCGILLSLLIFGSVLITAVFGGVRTNHRIPAFQINNIPSISGLYIFSYAGHIVFPDLYKAMKDPSKFTKVSIVSFTIVTSLYTALGFIGAKMFGPEISSQITLSMPKDFIVTKIALWATVITPMTKYALEFTPFAIELEHKLPNSLSNRTKMIIRGFVGSILLLIILALALTVPYFEYVLSLTGSLVGAAICMIFPCSFYLKICWGEIPKPLLIINLFIISLGLFLGGIGTISSSKSLIKIFQSHSA